MAGHTNTNAPCSYRNRGRMNAVPPLIQALLTKYSSSCAITHQRVIGRSRPSLRAVKLAVSGGSSGTYSQPPHLHPHTIRMLSESCFAEGTCFLHRLSHFAISLRDSIAPSSQKGKPLFSKGTQGPLSCPVLAVYFVIAMVPVRCTSTIPYGRTSSINSCTVSGSAWISITMLLGLRCMIFAPMTLQTSIREARFAVV